MSITVLAMAGLLAAAAAPGPRPGKLIVELRELETGRPASALVRVTSGGKSYGPAGKAGSFVLEGSLALKLPPARYRLRVDGGRRRLPYDRNVEIFSGETVKRVVFLKRPPHLDFARAGWLAVDPLFSAGGRPPGEAVRAARAAGLDAVGLERLTAPAARKLRRELPVFGWGLKTDPRFGSKGGFDPLWRPPRARPRRGAVLKRMTTAGFSFYADCGRPRRSNPWRTAVPWRPELGRFYDLLASRPLATRGLAPRMYFELAAGAPVGSFELDGSQSAEKLWFALLGQGYRIPAVAGTHGLLSRGDRPEPRMLVRLYPRPSRDWPAGDWLLRSMASGASTVSFGPFCFLSIDGAVSGRELPTVEKPRRLIVQALASTDRRAQIARVEIYRDGKLFRGVEPPSGHTGFKMELKIRQEEPAWLVAKCYQRIRARRGGGYVGAATTAITNPVWIEPTAYSTRPKAVVTKLKCKVVDAETGKPLDAHLVFDHRTRVEAAKGLKPFAAAGHFGCPGGAFQATVPAKTVFQVTSASSLDYEPKTVNILEALGFLSYCGHGGELRDFVRLEKTQDLFYDGLVEKGAWELQAVTGRATITMHVGYTAQGYDFSAPAGSKPAIRANGWPPGHAVRLAAVRGHRDALSNAGSAVVDEDVCRIVRVTGREVAGK